MAGLYIVNIVYKNEQTTRHELKEEMLKKSFHSLSCLHLYRI